MDTVFENGKADDMKGLTISTLTLFTRSVFRVAELSGGFGGHLANDEVSYMILEGAMVAIASVLLTVMHPGIGFGRQAVSHLLDLGLWKRNKC